LLEYRLIERRMRRFEELGREAPKRALPDALPLGPPGPESELQPEYRDSGKLRPEFEASGQLRDDLLGEGGRRGEETR
jgi:hypothetical protein